MTLVRLHSSEEFRYEVLEQTGPVLVVFPGRDSLLSEFVLGQLERVALRRERLKVISYTPADSPEEEEGITLLALYFNGNFVAATSRFYFAEHIDAWVERSLDDYHRIVEEDE